MTKFYDAQLRIIGEMLSIQVDDLGWPTLLKTERGIFQRYGMPGDYKYVREYDFDATGYVTWLD